MSYFIVVVTGLTFSMIESSVSSSYISYCYLIHSAHSLMNLSRLSFTLEGEQKSSSWYSNSFIYDSRAFVSLVTSLSGSSFKDDLPHASYSESLFSPSSTSSYIFYCYLPVI